MTRLAASSKTGSKFLIKIKNLFSFFSPEHEIYRFFKDNIVASYTREEAIAHSFMAVIFILSIGTFLLNAWVFHFTPTISSLNMVFFIPLWMVWWVIGHIHRPKWPRFGLVAATFANVGICTIIFMINWSAVLSTPFVIIDYHLVKWDHWLGFDVTTFMAWANQFPHLMKIFWFSYGTWEYQVILTPFLLAALNKSKEVNRYFTAAAICLIICNLIYYFFPTIAPAGVMHSPYFIKAEYDLVARFYEVHQSLPITHWGSGMVSFPSGHVMYALLVLYTVRKIKVVFYPLLVINCFLILATMAIGAHYLVDVIASFIIVTMVLLGMHFFLDRKSSLSESKIPALNGLRDC
ncbi:MAG: phosphatase PAP2 family protein [Proteobacteria bacterium]|nr:phosphatase PAP2 family protein [Pseudomonadota bacterium]